MPLLVLQCQIYPRRSGKKEKLRHNELAGQTTLAIIEKQPAAKYNTALLPTNRTLFEKLNLD